jgi:hypothetical protein
VFQARSEHLAALGPKNRRCGDGDGERSVPAARCKSTGPQTAEGMQPCRVAHGIHQHVPKLMSARSGLSGFYELSNSRESIL